jgi:hypothetical protein
MSIRAAANSFRVSDLQRVCPGVSIDWTRRVLKDLRSQGEVECLGRGQKAQPDCLAVIAEVR